MTDKIFIDGDFNNSYESRVRNSTGKKNINLDRSKDILYNQTKKEDAKKDTDSIRKLGATIPSRSRDNDSAVLGVHHGEKNTD